MKTLRSLLFLALAFAVGAPLARAQFVTTLSMLGSNPTFDAKGSLLTASVQAMFVQTTTVDGKTVAVVPQPNINWDGTSKTNTVEYNGQKFSYYDATMIVAAIANQELGAGAGTQAKARADKAAADAAAAKAQAAADAAAAAKVKANVVNTPVK